MAKHTKIRKFAPIQNFPLYGSLSISNFHQFHFQQTYSTFDSLDHNDWKGCLKTAAGELAESHCTYAANYTGGTYVCTYVGMGESLQLARCMVSGTYC